MGSKCATSPIGNLLVFRPLHVLPLHSLSTAKIIMEYSSLSTTTTHYYHSFSLLAGDSHPRFSLSSHNPEPPSTSSSSPHFPPNLRRPKTPLKTTSTTPSPPPLPKNPLKSLRISQTTPPSLPHNNLTTKLRLTSKISPPPPPTPPPNDIVSHNLTDSDTEDEEEEYGQVEFRQEGKIFVGNLPLWIKKPEVFEFFRQFGPIKSVILIKGHEDVDRTLGFGFVIFGGENADKSALKAVEFDGVEFHGRSLTVKLDDGRRLKNVAKERERWVQGGEGTEFRSKWHEEREYERKEFRRVVESQPENWQAVLRAFQRIKKV